MKKKNVGSYQQICKEREMIKRPAQPWEIWDRKLVLLDILVIGAKEKQLFIPGGQPYNIGVVN